VSKVLVVLANMLLEQQGLTLRRHVLPVRRPLVHGECGRLPVRLAAVVTVVGLGVGVHDVMLVQTRVLREPLPTTHHCTHVWLLTCNQGSFL